MQTIILKTQEGMRTEQAFKDKWAVLTKSFEARQKQLQEKQGQLQAAAKAGDEAKTRLLEQEVSTLHESVTKAQESYAAAADRDNTAALEKLGRNLMAAIDQYARENKYALVLTSDIEETDTLQQDHVVWFLHGVQWQGLARKDLDVRDINTQVIALYDRLYPVTAGGK